MDLVDHIAIFDNVLTKEHCEKLMDYYEYWDKRRATHNRENPALMIEDKQLFIDQKSNPDGIDLYTDDHVSDIIVPALNNCYTQYLDNYSILKEGLSHTFYQLKMQKTLPKQGYHVWHYERDDRKTTNRITSFLLYLNDVDNGGETEFLYQSLRVAPKAGRMVIFPSAYTHTHRGNPPLNGVKYIVAGCSEFR